VSQTTRLTDSIETEAMGHPRRWLALSVLCVSVFLAVVDNTIVNVALPTMSRQLDASVSGLQWIVDSYALVFSALLLIGGSLGDRFGRKRTLQLGIVLFAGFSVFAGESDSVGNLIAGRALMGAAGALIFPATLAILSNLFADPAERAKAIGIWSGVIGLAVALGPVTGGLLLEHFWWGSVFYVNIPIAGVALIAGARILPESSDPDTPTLDWIGFATSAAAVVLIVFSIIEAPRYGWDSARTLGGLTLGLMVMAGFVWWEARHDEPMLDVSVFTNIRFSAASFSVTVGFLALFGFIFLVTQYFQFVRGYSTLSAGLHTLPFAIGTAAISPFSPTIANKIGPRIVVPAGLAIMAAGFVGAGFTNADSNYWGIVVASMLAIAFGLGLVVPPSTDTILGSLPPNKAGVGSAINDVTREFGGTLGVAILGSVFASVYGTRIIDRLTIDDPELFDAASESVGAALAIAEQAPPDTGPMIVTAAQDAFMAGFNQGSFVAGAVVATGAVFAVAVLPSKAAS
jgi:EmrB/QacA subfamily drug resistance transporter